MTAPRHFKETQLDLEWSKLQELTSHILVTNFRDSGLGHRYAAMLNAIKQDIVTPKATFLGMRRAPASKNRHHDIEGGLVTHLLEMWRLWTSLRSIIDAEAYGTMLNDSFVWRAILHHDLNKIHRYKLVSEDPWEVDYGENMTNSLLSSTHMVLWTLAQHEISMPLALHNALIVAEGGFSRDERPKAECVLAKVVYILDELSANVVDRLGAGRLWDSKHGGLDAQG